MALKSRFAGLHLVFRLLGLTGLMTLIVAAVLWKALPSDYEEIVLKVGYGAAAALGLALLVEIRGVAAMFGSRRAGLGSNVILQALLAVVLVAGINFWSFQSYRRFDWTWDQSFTLPADVQRQLAQLRGTTDIVVYQKYVSFTQRGEATEDKYDLAAHKKIVEKVRDLAELFQDLGPRFRVQLLDIQDDNFDARMKDLRKMAPALASAIDKAPENSIFFHSGGKVQRLAFHDVYQVDKQASQDDNNGQGNLVLNFQGVEPIARRILNIEEKAPRIATAVVHPYLTMSDRDNLYLTMSGAKKVLDNYGFDCKDLLMRKVEEGGGLSPDAAVLTFAEGRYEQIEEELALLNESISQMQKEHDETAQLHRKWHDSSLAELNKTYAYVILEGGNQGVILRSQVENIKKSGRNFKLMDVDNDDKQFRVKSFDRDLVILKTVLDANRQERDALLKEKQTLSADELGEKRRITDIEIKMKRELADRDLLIIPRFTAINIPRGERISNRVHKLDVAQIRAIKHFLREGKAVLFLLGPINESEDDAPFREPDAGDELEPMLAELGIVLPKQTVLFHAEAKDYNERKVGVMFAGRETELPSVKFEWQPEAVRRGPAAKSAPHPIRTSLNLMSRAVGMQQGGMEQGGVPQAGMDLRIRHPRPVYVRRTRLAPGAAASVVAGSSQPGWTGALSAASSWLGQRETILDDGAVLFVTSEESWNEDQPFITKKGVPRYEPTKDDDPKKNTPEEERLGPHPIGVAIETSVPATWFDDGKPIPKARIAVIGHGGLFTGQSLSPIKEKLLLDTINWLVGRDDLLARRSEQPWKYPRVDLAEWQVLLWQMGAVFGLPVIFLYFGAMMWLVRSMR
ncbi:MAG: hypothetical protein L0Y71_03665 [Gemmataceae bacterium]|nr:hypothetical protein [Gemmataceae bacterium]